jgi:hypothetical protein
MSIYLKKIVISDGDRNPAVAPPLAGRSGATNRFTKFHLFPLRAIISCTVCRDSYFWSGWTLPWLSYKAIHSWISRRLLSKDSRIGDHVCRVYKSTVRPLSDDGNLIVKNQAYHENLIICKAIYYFDQPINTSGAEIEIRQFSSVASKIEALLRKIGRTVKKLS